MIAVAPRAARPRFPVLPFALAGAGLALSLALLVHAWNLRRVARGYGEELPHLSSLPGFSTISETGATVTKETLAGQVWIADFIFTTCGGTCPGMTAKMRSLQERLRSESGVRLVSFTVDPEHDTPEVLARYGLGQGADPRRWSFLRTDKDAIRTLCRTGFRLSVEDAGEGVEPILHSTRFVLVDGTGTIRGYFDSNEPGAMDALVTGARFLARSGASPR